MIRTNVPHKFLTILLFSFLISYSAQANWEPAKDGDKIILIRHSIAPGSGDPAGFKINDCKTQRNLSEEGINQSKKIGKLFKKNKVPIDQILSSQWCRCKDTAKYAFGDYKEFTALNSTFQSPYDKNETKQLKELYNFVKKWDGDGKNLVLVTHYSIITAITTAVPSSGEIIIADKNFKVISTIATD